MENLVIPNYKSYINKKILDWTISECEDVGPIYAIILKKESLETLKDINLLSNYGQEVTTGDGVVEQGDGEGQDGDVEPQESDD